MSKVKLLLLAVLLSPGIVLAAAKETASWDNLKQLRPGDRIEVIDQSLKSYRGTFVSVSEDAIVLESKGDSSTVERVKVLRVSKRDSSKRTRNMLLGAAIGAGAGLAISLPIEAVASNEGNGAAGVVAGVTAGAAGAGLAVGSTMGNRLIYRAEKRE